MICVSKKAVDQNKESLKYQKLYRWGKTLITSGVIKHMEKFPSEHVLQNKFGCSRQTVRAALDLLERDGYISRVRGSGTYVAYESGHTQDERPHIGLILSSYLDYLFPQVYNGIESVLSEKGYEIDVAVTRNRIDDEAMYLETLLNSDVSGYIIEGTCSAFPNPNIRFYQEIRKRGTPVLFIHNHYENLKFDSVEMSDARGSYELTKKLIQSGHRKIGGIFKYDDMQGIERYRGFVECLSDYRIRLKDEWVLWFSSKDMKEKFTRKNLLRTYRRTRDCTAMILHNDEIFVYYMELLKERGLRVPEDLSLASFDDAERVEDTGLKVLSVVHPKYTLGRIAARNLVRMIEEGDMPYKTYSYRFPVVLNDGNSVRNIRKSGVSGQFG